MRGQHLYTCSHDDLVTLRKVLPREAIVALIAHAIPPSLEYVPTGRLRALAEILGGERSGGADSAPPRATRVLLTELARVAANPERTRSTLLRAGAVLVMLHRLGAIAFVKPEQLLVAFADRARWARVLLAPLAAWCDAQLPIPAPVVELVVSLRENDRDDDPRLARLAVWVAPSVESLTDLARWEATHRQRWWGDEAFAHALPHWVTDDIDSTRDAHAFSALAEWGGVEYVRRAIERHGDVARRALAEAAQIHSGRGGVGAVLEAWAGGRL